MTEASLMQFCRTEFQKLFIPDPELIALCKTFAGSFQPDGPAATTIICERIESALQQGMPLSILRVGNGEGNAVSMTKSSIYGPLKEAFYVEFNSQNGVAVPVTDAIQFCDEVRIALMSADIIGFRSFRFAEGPIIDCAITRGDAYAALGILYAREFLQNGLLDTYLRGKIITCAWIHLDILPSIDRLLNSTDSIIVISGRSELEEAFSSRLRSRLKEFMSIPVQGFIPSSPSTSHFYKAFPEVRQCLHKDLRGTLVLVGGGLFGKIYCQEAKINGAVAVDLGSAFDVLAGLNTRPIHSAYDINAVRWV